LGVASYRKYQRGHHAAPDQSFTFKFDGFSFFMLDTRSDRPPRTADQLTGLDPFVQVKLTALEAWLTNPANDGPKFIVTPAMLLPRHRRTVQHAPMAGGLDAQNLSSIHSDGWDGYPDALRAVLGILAKNAVKNVVFLSGDEHRGCVANIELRDASGGTLLTRVHSIHTTAAYAPFPFANSGIADFVESEVIDFKFATVGYKCVVSATLPTSRDGATSIRPYWRTINTSPPVGEWRLDYEYTDGGVQTLTL
jgi:hypothetical protein